MDRWVIVELLERCSDFLDNYVDVNDGEDGRPVPNRAMSLKRDVDEVVERLEQVEA